MSNDGGPISDAAVRVTWRFGRVVRATRLIREFCFDPEQAPNLIFRSIRFPESGAPGQRLPEIWSASSARLDSSASGRHPSQLSVAGCAPSPPPLGRGRKDRLSD